MAASRSGLKAHQQIAVDFLLNHRQAALFMGVGLGKTYTVLTAFEGLRLMGQARTMLVVAPLRVCNLTWPNEVAKWPQFSHLTVANLRTKDGRAAWKEDTADIYLCNYEMLHQLADRVTEKCPDVIVFDELTRAKNPTSKRINALRTVLPPHVVRWGLTGTPTPNSLLEIFAQIRLLDGGKRLGQSFDLFKRTYFYPTDYMEYDWQPLPGAAEKIHQRIEDICLTLLSSQYLNIPDSVVTDIEVTMPDEAMSSYKELEKEFLLAIGVNEEEIVLAPNAGVLANKLLQVTGGSVYGENKQVVHLHDAKLRALQRCLADRQEPALVVYNYRHELERMREALPFATAFEDYETPEEQARMEKLWNEGKVRVLLVHPLSVGHGLNMQAGGSTVIWFSPPWSRELYDQMNGRVIRSGQTRVQNIIRIICPGTIDDAVIETLHNRDEGQRALLNALINLRKLRQK